MSADGATPVNSPSDTAVVTAQIGRAPRGPWRVATRCRYGFPSTVAVAPRLEDGTPFPTLYWLTCPFLASQVAQAESDGHIATWSSRLDSEEDLNERMHSADAQYRAMRLLEGEGDDPCAQVGIAGQADPCATKCLHVHVSAFLAGVDDPIGYELVTMWGTDCGDQRCSRFTAEATDD